MPQPPVNRISSALTEENRPDAKTMAALIEDAEALKLSLRDVLLKTTSLIAGLKHQRKQTRLMRSTLESLKQLQTIET